MMPPALRQVHKPAWLDSSYNERAQGRTFGSNCRRRHNDNTFFSPPTVAAAGTYELLQIRHEPAIFATLPSSTADRTAQSYLLLYFTIISGRVLIGVGLWSTLVIFARRHWYSPHYPSTTKCFDKVESDLHHPNCVAVLQQGTRVVKSTANLIWMPGTD